MTEHENTELYSKLLYFRAWMALQGIQKPPCIGGRAKQVGRLLRGLRVVGLVRLVE
jgi:hypothetical protein